MAEINQSLIGTNISFTLYSAATLSQEYSNVEVLAIGSYRIATGYIAPAQLHAIVYPTLPADTIPNDYRAYEYVVVQLPTGVTTAVGIPWIVPSSITVNDTVELEVIVRDKSIDDIPRLRQILTKNGFLNTTVKIKNP